MNNIVLIGLMTAGKTTVGKILAQKLTRPVLDTDDMVEAHTGKKIGDIFAESGEVTFRELESKMFAKACQQQGSIISTGGGAMQREENKNLAQTQHTVYLRATAKTLAHRVENSSQKRPLVQGFSGQDLVDLAQKYLDERTKNYTDVAMLIVDTDAKSPDETAQEIIQKLEQK